MLPRLLKRREVEKATRLSRATLYRLMSSGKFPRPVCLGARSVAWREDEVAAWIESRPASNSQSQSAA